MCKFEQQIKEQRNTNMHSEDFSYMNMHDEVKNMETSNTERVRSSDMHGNQGKGR